MKNIFLAVLILVFSVLLFYLFIKPSEFEVNLKARTVPGDVIETIRIWNRSLNEAHIVEVDSFNSVSQTIVWKTRRYNYKWKFINLNDSLTHVNVQISEPGRTFINKFLVPFTDQNIEKDAEEIVTAFYEVLKTHLKITKVKVIGEVEMDSSFCVCRRFETDQLDKANGMMRDYPLLTSFINDFGLKLDGPPIVKVLQWDHNNGLLKFDFCFPIIKADSLPTVEGLVYLKIEKTKALKAEYYGNYITSDRAWYALVQYADENGYKTDRLPIEYFYDNPNLGMNEIKWKAEVYLSIYK